jgi:hypothetical protein
MNKNKYKRKQWAVRFRPEYIDCYPWEAVFWEPVFSDSVPILCLIGSWRLSRDFNSEVAAENYIAKKIAEENKVIEKIDGNGPRIRRVPPFKFAPDEK